MHSWSSSGQLLTGMPARQGFLAALDELVRTPTKRPRAHVGALALVDVDNFDEANQRLGYGAGDRLLGAVASTLNEMVGAVAGQLLVARIGGDEFGVLAAGTTAHALADRLGGLPTGTASLSTGHGPWSPTVSMGISGIRAGEALDRPMVRADQALNQAKSRGRAQVQVYDSSTHQFALDRRDTFAQIEALRMRLARLGAEVRTDALTGVGNRRALDEHLSRLAATWSGPSEVLFVDIDRFHAFNHTRGQEAGDDALRRVAAVLADSGRAEDRTFRRGGEEFVVVLADTNRADALRAAQRHRQAVEALAIPHGGTPQTPIVTVTICVATASASTLAPAIERAAETAFAAKDLGAVNVVLEAPGEAPQQGPSRG